MLAVAQLVEMRAVDELALLGRDRYVTVDGIADMNSERSLIWHFFFFSSRRRHTRLQGDWSSDVCSSDLYDRSFATCAGKQKNIQPAVVIVVEESDSTAHGFQDIVHAVRWAVGDGSAQARDRKSVV